MRGYYRWLGRTMMAVAVLLPAFWTLLVLSLAGHPTVTLANTLPPLLGVYAMSVAAFLIGRVLAKIPPGQ